MPRPAINSPHRIEKEIILFFCSEDRERITAEQASEYITQNPVIADMLVNFSSETVETRKASRLLGFLRENYNIRVLCNRPAILEMLCVTWNIQELQSYGRTEFIKDIITFGLYQYLENIYKSCLRNGLSTDDALNFKAAVKYISELAFHTKLSNQDSFKLNDIAFTQHDIMQQELINTLKARKIIHSDADDQDYRFSDEIIQDYLSANYISELLLTRGQHVDINDERIDLFEYIKDLKDLTAKQSGTQIIPFIIGCLTTKSQNNSSYTENLNSIFSILLNLDNKKNGYYSCSYSDQELHLIIRCWEESYSKMTGGVIKFKNDLQEKLEAAMEMCLGGPLDVFKDAKEIWLGGLLDVFKECPYVLKSNICQNFIKYLFKIEHERLKIAYFQYYVSQPLSPSMQELYFEYVAQEPSLLLVFLHLISYIINPDTQSDLYRKLECKTFSSKKFQESYNSTKPDWFQVPLIDDERWSKLINEKYQLLNSTMPNEEIEELLKTQYFLGLHLVPSKRPKLQWFSSSDEIDDQRRIWCKQLNIMYQLLEGGIVRARNEEAQKINHLLGLIVAEFRLSKSQPTLPSSSAEYSLAHLVSAEREKCTGTSTAYHERETLLMENQHATPPYKR